MVVGVVRGYRLSKHPTTGTLYRPDGTINFSTLGANGQPTWKLYDAIAAPAVVGSPPRSPDFDPPQNHADKYGVGGTGAGDGFYWDHFNRRTMVYLPTNGGMLHGFDGETGDEIVRLHSRRRDGARAGRSRGKPGPPLRVRGAGRGAEQRNPRTISSRCPERPRSRTRFSAPMSGGDNEWHTMLTFGRGRGGRALSALDVTDPLAPRLRFNIVNREGSERRASRRNGRDLVDSGHGERPDHEPHVEPRSNRSVARLLRRRLRLQQRRERRPVPLRRAARERLGLSPRTGDERHDGGHPAATPW